VFLDGTAPLQGAKDRVTGAFDDTKQAASETAASAKESAEQGSQRASEGLGEVSKERQHYCRLHCRVSVACKVYVAAACHIM
jgi:hypothetical protein